MSEIKTEDLTFEEAEKRIDEIIKELQNKDTGIEASIKLYNEAMELVVFCSKKLDSYAKEIGLKE